jgi:tetratricopeptide (TPR) repeat protein
MNIPKKYLKLMPVLLFIGLIIFFIADPIGSKLKQSDKPSPTNENTNKGLIHNHNEEKIDHNSPEAQKRMGIYHYNEGNKFLKINKTEEAINNYKMALHHNNRFEEAYVNLSTAYLNKEKFKLSLQTLKTLESINPKHPLLHYNFSCYYSLLGDIEKGIGSLKKAIKNGFKNHKILKTDPHIENLRQSNEFKELQTLLTKVSH